MNNKSRWQIAIILALLLSSIMWELPMRAASQDKGRPVAAVEEGETAEVSEQIVSEMPINSGYESPGNSHKIQVRDAQKAKELLSGSGKLVASYGEFQIIEVDNATLKKVRKEVGVELRDEYNLVLLNSGAIDTTTEEA
ncbi:MAG: hypothetical protein JNN15_13920, partial [Blastocatellia bacterium]|nr:hypothetical protein [Blastocatellia bacterium]